MKAIVITGVGGPEVLELREVATPEPRGDEMRVHMQACGVNRADLLQTGGYYPAPAGVPSDIPGLEYAGEVNALGPDVIGPLKVGDRVFGIVAGGAQAEYLVTHERMAVPIPADLDFVAAAAVPEGLVTAHVPCHPGSPRPRRAGLDPCRRQQRRHGGRGRSRTQSDARLRTSRTAEKLERGQFSRPGQADRRVRPKTRRGGADVDLGTESTS